MSRPARYFLYAIIILALLLIGLRGVGWWIFHRGLPQLDGTQELFDLKNEVTVQRDARGVPHIRASSKADLFEAQGYVMAQDRLWQMDLVRRAASGRLSEIIGPQTLEIDRSFRRLGLSEAADREVSLLDPDERAALESFSYGVNHYIRSQTALPVEFTILRYSPELWRPADSLLVIGYMYQSLTSSWRWDIDRLEVSARIGKERASFLYDPTSPYDHPIVGAQSAPPKKPARSGAIDLPEPAGESRPGFVDAALHDRVPAPTADNATPALWSFAQNTLFQFDEQVRSAFGSNNWVVDGSHTASGKPLLANDTHLPLSTPSIWYIVQLSASGWNAEGFTLPGVPGIVIGHNDKIAWGFTNDGADVQDLFVETFNPANPLEYRVNGNWVAAQTRKEIINVKGKLPETLNVIVTRHGPIMSLQENTGYALKWTATEPGGLAHSYFGIQFAHNWKEFRESLRDAAGPGQNIVYADVEGHIGFIVAAKIPLRKCGAFPPADSPLPADTPCGAAPMPGDTDAFGWNGYIPFDELPQVLDPPGGIIATANAQVAGQTYPHFMTATWMTPWRVDRIFTLLSEPDKKFQAEDFNAIQNDIVAELDVIVAKELVKAAANAKPKDDRTAKLIQMVANWDGKMTSSSVEATFVEQTERAIGRKLFHPFMADSLPVYPRGEVFLERVLRERPAMWLPAEFHSYDDFLIAGADLAVAELTTSMRQSDISTWTWGKRNALFMAHALGQTGFLAKIFSIGPIEQSGATGCIKAMGPSYGPSMRMVADTSNWDHSLMEITTGESGQVSSDNYQDQFPEWFAGRAIPSQFSDATVQRATVHTLSLVPGKQ
jgi:penicillin G amidase